MLHIVSMSSFQPSRSLSPSVSMTIVMNSASVSVLVPDTTWTEYSVICITASGVPHIVPLPWPNERPAGSSGDISQSWTGDPLVCPAKGCISWPSTSVNEGVGKLRAMPSPMTDRVTSTVVVPPVLTAVMLREMGAVMRYGFPYIFPER